MNEADRYRDAEAQLLCAEQFPLLQPFKPSSVLLRVWEYPAFREWTSWTLINSNGGVLLRRLIWHRTTSALAPDDFMLVGADATFLVDRWRVMRTQLQQVVLPAFAGGDVEARDGTAFGIEWTRLGGSARLHWWPEPPAGWEALACWQQQAAAEFQRHLPAHVAPSL